jgi:hypothetical protein
MGKRKDITVEEKTKILCWKEEGVSTADIAARLGRHPAAIRKQYAILKNLPPMTPPSSIKKRLGGITKISFAMKNRLRQAVLKHPFKSAKELKKDVPGWDKISVHMIQHVLQKQLGLPSRVAAKKPLLTQTMVKKRLRFCLKYKNWTERDWASVMFSDESTFRILNSRGGHSEEAVDHGQVPPEVHGRHGEALPFSDGLGLF